MVWVEKVASMRGQEAEGFANGIRSALQRVNERTADATSPTAATGHARIAAIVHGTTVGTNALLERRVARTGLITTRGFRDVLEMRRRDRPQTWGLWGMFEPLVERALRIEVDERVLADGSVHTPLDEGQVLAAIAGLRAQGCEAVCVFFINAYANEDNERRAAALVRQHWPNAHVTASHEILPEIREFERASTAALNACLQPVVGGYLRTLSAQLQAEQFAGQLLIVQSNGGVVSSVDAARFPVRTALSGPAAGVIACAHIAQAAGHANVITADMGGTSFDVSIIAQGHSAVAPQTAIDFGLVIRTPMIDIHTIGAGGGSIARVDAGGLLQVGPESAGSNPGPVCYARGNRRPTITDANVVLGRIDAARPIGSLQALDVAAARDAIRAEVADPLGLSAEAAAQAILTVANARMAGAVRLVSIERGHDPARFVYLPFGGGGALHVCAMMREVGMYTGLIPRFPGITSALGCVIADVRMDQVRTINRLLTDLDPDTFAADVARSVQDLTEQTRRTGVPLAGIRVEVELDMLYAGQTHTLAVPLPTDAGLHWSRTSLARAFDERYRQTFGRLLANIAVRIVNRRVTVTGLRPRFDLSLLAPASAGTLDAAHRGKRPVFHDHDWQEADVWQRLALPVGASLGGPAILEQPDTTIWLEPGMQARVDELGNLVITRG